MATAIDNLLAAVAESPRAVPWGQPASAAAFACAERRVLCEACGEPAAGQCRGCGKYLCAEDLDRHRRDADREACRGGRKG